MLKLLRRSYSHKFYSCTILLFSTCCMFWCQKLGPWLHLVFCHTGTSIGTIYITNGRYILLMCNSALFQWTQRFLKYFTQPLEWTFLFMNIELWIYLNPSSSTYFEPLQKAWTLNQLWQKTAETKAQIQKNYKPFQTYNDFTKKKYLWFSVSNTI